MSENTRRTAGVPLGAYSDYRPGQRVMTCDEIPGRVISVQEGPASNRIEVVLDNGMGGGIYDDSMLRPLNERSSSVTRTAVDDYPELGSILTERPDLAPVISESEYLGGRRTASLAKQADFYLDTPESLALSEAAAHLLSASNAALHRVQSASEVVPEHLSRAVVSAAKVHCSTCGVDYFIDSEAEKHDHSKQADYHLYLPPADDKPGNDRSPAYADGRQQAQAGGAREPKSPGDAAYMAEFDMGWAHGVQTRPNPPEMPLTDPSDLVDDTLDPDKVASRREGGIVDFIQGDSTPSRTWDGPGHNYSFDWCRFRKNSRCMFPKELNKPATELAGYAVWIPEDRGYCPRVSWDNQQDCPVGEPGPNVPGGYTDATVAWEDGGQRGGHPQPSYRQSAKTAVMPTGPMEEYVRPLQPDETCAWDHQRDCSCGTFLYGEASDNWSIEHGHAPQTDADLAEVEEWAKILADPDDMRCSHCRLDHEFGKTAAAGDGFGFHFTAAWSDVRKKAKRIRQEGGVRVLSSMSGDMTAQVKGDHHVYQTRVSTVPGRFAVGSWECGCPWAAYSWGRTGPWKKYEGRMCSHALACVYEAQSRGMFGKEITEDAVAPAWVPKGGDVKVPGDWDRDLGAYTSAKAEDSWELVALLVASGRPIAEIHPTVMAMALDGGHAVASSGPLTGQVGGRVRDLLFEDGDVVDSATGTKIPGPVLYPSYDPHAGLTVASKEAPMGAEHWAMTFESVERVRDADVRVNIDTNKSTYTLDLPHVDVDEIEGEVHDFVAPWRTSALDGAFALSIADLHDEPEAALPTTDGSDEDGDMEQARQALLASAAISSETCPSCGLSVSVLRQDPDHCPQCGAKMPSDDEDDTTRTAKKDPHAWLMAGAQPSSDVANMAQAFLANRKEALRDFSAAERKSIIDEGEGVLAGNFDGLDLSGTHYQALEQAQAAQHTNDSIF